jgi:hypothetical protein
VRHVVLTNNVVIIKLTTGLLHITMFYKYWLNTVYVRVPGYLNATYSFYIYTVVSVLRLCRFFEVMTLFRKRYERIISYTY